MAFFQRVQPVAVVNLLLTNSIKLPGSPLHYEAERGKLHVVGVEISENPERAAVFESVARNMKWIDSIVKSHRCTDARTFKFSFRKFFWFVVVLLLTGAVVLVVLYFVERPAYDKLRDWFYCKCFKKLAKKSATPPETGA